MTILVWCIPECDRSVAMCSICTTSYAMPSSANRTRSPRRGSEIASLATLLPSGNTNHTCVTRLASSAVGPRRARRRLRSIVVGNASWSDPGRVLAAGRFESAVTGALKQDPTAQLRNQPPMQAARTGRGPNVVHMTVQRQNAACRAQRRGAQEEDGALLAAVRLAAPPLDLLSWSTGRERDRLGPRFTVAVAAARRRRRAPV